MPMNTAYRNALRDHGQSLITHVGLVDGGGVAVAGVARQPVTWTDSADGVSRPSADHDFTVASGDIVGGWRGYSALTAGIDYGGDDFTPVTFSNPGTFKLRADLTAINHNAVA